MPAAPHYVVTFVDGTAMTIDQGALQALAAQGSGARALNQLDDPTTGEQRFVPLSSVRYVKLKKGTP